MSILRRTVTIIIVAPTVLKIIQTWYGTIFLCWLLHFIAMIEWTGLKRHLKLCLLDPLIHSQRKRLQDLQRFKATLSLTSKNNKKKEDDDDEEQEQSTMRKRRASSSSKTTPKRNNSGSSSSSNKKKNATTTTLDDSSPSLGLFGEPEEEDLVVLEGLDPWTDREFPTPVAPINLFILLKCLACSLIVPLGYFSPEHFLLMLSLYFFFWVVLTLLDRNRSEMKQDVARRIIQEKDATKNEQTNNNNNKQASSPSGGNYKTRSQQRFEQATKPLPDSNEFALRELEIVSCYPNVETFINFSIEYFGFVWISNMGFGPMIFQLGEQGQAALAACLFANWANDAGALAAGKTIKGLFGEHATRPLYPRISPSKSLEGAVFGILCNAVFASLAPYALPALRDNFHNKEAVPRYFFIIGLMLGVLGVIGDLLQSLFKRVSRIKDTGTFFPGHGGVLDRIDGFVTTLPIVYWMVWALQKGYFDPLLDPNYTA